MLLLILLKSGMDLLWMILKLRMSKRRPGLVSNQHGTPVRGTRVGGEKNVGINSLGFLCK